jgi:putative zinc finger protein
MKCHEAKRHLDLFMDGELSVPENLKVLEHLNLCRPCSSVYEGEKALRGALRSRLGDVRAPEGLADKLSAPADAAPRLEAVGPVAGRSRLFSAAAAAAIFAVAVLFLLTTPGEKPKALATELSKMHKETRQGFCGQHRNDCVCLCGTCGETVTVDKFFKRQVGRETCTHPLTDLGYSPVGASVERHRGQPVCWTVHQDKAGHTITHGLITTKIAMEPGPLLVCDGVERPVVLIPAEGGMTCAFVFDSEGEAMRFRSARKLK